MAFSQADKDGQLSRIIGAPSFAAADTAHTNWDNEADPPTKAAKKKIMNQLIGNCMAERGIPS